MPGLPYNFIKEVDEFKRHSIEMSKKCYKRHHEKAQIREQMSGPEISWYGKLILGCGLWPGLDCEIKGLGGL